MAINNGTQQYQNTHNFINLAQLAGSGESTMFVDDVEGILLGIETRDGSYTVNDRRTGQPITRPNSWIGHWMTDQGEKLMSWPTYIDETTGQVMPWSRFDSSINLAQCSAQQIRLHMWKDERNFYHLEVVKTQVQQNLNPMPVVMGQQAPWTPQN